MLERAIRDRVCRVAHEQFGVRSIQLNLGQDSGWPDRLFLIPGGRPLLVEFKRPGGKPRPLQKERIAFLKRQGYSVAVVDDSDDGIVLVLDHVLGC